MQRIVTILAGVILLIAGVLKARELGSDAGIGVERTRWGWAMLAGGEVALGYCLVAGLFPAQAACAARLAFLAFAVVALHKAISGEASCSCFGAARVHPWATFVLDSTIFAGLTTWRWGQLVDRVPTSRPAGMRLAAHALVPLLLALIPPTLTLSATATRPSALAVAANPVSLGVIGAGKASHFRLAVSNTGPSDVSIASIEASCPCVRPISQLPRRIGPMEGGSLAFSIDLSDEPGYRGDLAIVITGRDSVGGALFQAEVRVTVAEGPGSAAP